MKTTNFSLPVFSPIKLETIVRLDISIAEPPPPNNMATAKISYLADSPRQPTHIHMQAPFESKNVF